MTISVSNLGKRFNQEWIFKGLTTEFKSGNTYAITGPNGSGKSTLMQVLWGQVPASEGTITYSIDNLEIPHDEVFQHIAIATPYMDIVEEFTLKEQVEFHFKFKNPAMGFSLATIIEKMQLGDSGNKPISQFSSGMRQRLKLGLAMFSEFKLLFLDEPTTNLDGISADWYKQQLAEIAGKKLVFIATNQPSDYPEGIPIISLVDLKKTILPPAHQTGREWQVTNTPKKGIQTS